MLDRASGPCYNGSKTGSATPDGKEHPMAVTSTDAGLDTRLAMLVAMISGRELLGFNDALAEAREICAQRIRNKDVVVDLRYGIAHDQEGLRLIKDAVVSPTTSLTFEIDTHVGRIWLHIAGPNGYHNRNTLAGSGRTLIQIMLRDAGKDMALIEGYKEVALGGR